jgi:hypothetical protein
MSYRREPYLIALGLLWAFGVTLLRGLRRPNDWAEAHWLISYDFGPIKRGLPGTLLKPLLAAAPAQAEVTITIVSFAITAVFCVVLLALCWSILRRCGFSTNAVLLVAAFLTSPFVVMSGHLNGYSDAQIILLSIAAVALTMRGRTWPAALVLSVGLLIHETIFVIGLPIAVWATLLRPGEETGRVAWGRLAPFLLPLVAFAVLFVYQSFAVDAAELESALIAHLEGFPFIEYDQEVIVPRSFAKSFVAHFRAQSPRVWGRLFDPALMVAILPNVLLILAFALGALRAGQIPRRLRSAVVLLPFLPLGLHLIAWDKARIWTYPILVGLLAVWVACQVGEPERLASLDSRLVNIGGLVVLPLNVFGHIALMDWRVERFSAVWRAVLYLPLAAALVLAFARRRNSDYTRTVENRIFERR